VLQIRLVSDFSDDLGSGIVGSGSLSRHFRFRKKMKEEGEEQKRDERSQKKVERVGSKG